MPNQYPIREEKPGPPSEIQKNPGGENSHKLSKVTTGKVTRRKQSGLRKLAGAFFAEDLKTVLNDMIYEVAIPRLKDMFLDGMSMLIRGNTYTGRRNDYVSANNRVNYSAYSYRSRDDRGDRGRGAGQRNPRNIDDIVFETRIDCEEVIAQLYKNIQDYETVSVADFYDACGITGEFTDNKWGWKRGAEFYPRRVADGYIIDFPRVTLID